MWSQDTYKKALDFAAQVHGDQRVPGSGFPYAVHLAKVSMEAIAACSADPSLDGDLVIACALLHDCIEDAAVSASEISRVFDARVAAGVEALTKNSALPKESQMEDSLLRIRRQPREIWVVKLADRITNLEPPPASWPRAKCEKYLAEAKIILERLSGASPPLERRLAEKINAYSRHFANRA